MKGNWNSLGNIALVSGPLLAAVICIFCDFDPGHPEVTLTAAVAFLMAFWWITEAIPLAVTALLPMALFPLLGIMDGRRVAPLYFNHIIFLFLGGFFVALAMERWDLHRRIALKVLLFFGPTPKYDGSHSAGGDSEIRRDTCFRLLHTQSPDRASSRSCIRLYVGGDCYACRYASQPGVDAHF